MKGVIRATREREIVEHYYHGKEEARNLIAELIKYRKIIIEFIPDLQSDFTEMLPGGYDPEIAESIFKSRCKIIHYEARTDTTENSQYQHARRCAPCHWSIIVSCIVDHSVYSSALQKVI